MVLLVFILSKFNTFFLFLTKNRREQIPSMYAFSLFNEIIYQGNINVVGCQCIGSLLLLSMYFQKQQQRIQKHCQRKIFLANSNKIATFYNQKQCEVITFLFPSPLISLSFHFFFQKLCFYDKMANNSIQLLNYLLFTRAPSATIIVCFLATEEEAKKIKRTNRKKETFQALAHLGILSEYLLCGISTIFRSL